MYQVEVFVNLAERTVLVVAIVAAGAPEADPVSVELSALLSLVLRRQGPGGTTARL